MPRGVPGRSQEDGAPDTMAQPSGAHRGVRGVVPPEDDSHAAQATFVLDELPEDELAVDEVESPPDFEDDEAESDEEEDDPLSFDPLSLELPSFEPPSLEPFSFTEDVDEDPFGSLPRLSVR